jgi:hypothetical protein
MFARYSSHFTEQADSRQRDQKTGAPMMLVKSYKGVELKQPVHLLELSSTQATLQATDSMFASLMEGPVYLYSQAFTRPIAGRIQGFQSSRGIFYLADFTEIDWLARQSERVQPHELTFIQARCKHKMARLRLDDLSLTGMGVVAAPLVCGQARPALGQVLKLDFTLAGITFTELKAKVLYQVHLGQWLEKMGLRLMPTVAQRRQLEEYIASRKEEILAEVWQLHMQTRQLHGIESQYF